MHFLYFLSQRIFGSMFSKVNELQDKFSWGLKNPQPSRKKLLFAYCTPPGYQTEMSAKGERKEGQYCVWAAVANLVGVQGGSAAVAVKCPSFIWLDFPDHKSADLEGHPHSLTTVHKPLASKDVVWQLGKECSVAVSATLGFCASASATGTPNAQGEVNQMSGQALRSCVRGAISWDRQCGCYTGPCNRGGGRLCAIRKEVMQPEGETTLSPEPGVPPGVRPPSCNATGPLSLHNIYTYVYTPIQTIY